MVTSAPKPESGPDPSLLAWVEAIPDGVAISDVEGRIVRVNRALEAASGYSSEELVGREVETLVPTGYRDEHRRLLAGTARPRAARRPMGTGLDLSLRHKDGTRVRVDVVLGTFRLRQRTLVVGSIRAAGARGPAGARTPEGERWHELFDTIGLPVVGRDPEGQVTYANPFLCHLTGYRRDELLGRDWSRFCLAEGAIDGVHDGFAKLWAHGSLGRHVTPIVTKAGPERVLVWDDTAIDDADGSHIATMSIGEDITDQLLAQQRLAAVNDVARAILDDAPVDEVFRTIVEHSRALVGASNATIATPEAGGETLVVRVAAGEHASQLEGTRFPALDSITGHVMRSGEPLSIDDVSADPRVAQPVVRISSVGPALFVPLTVADRTFGTLLIGRPLGAPSFTEEDLRVSELFASQAAVALEHARYQEELHLLAVLEDRERIGRELHDGTIQQLFATGMKLQAVLGIVPADAAGRIDEAVDELDRVVKDVRGYIWSLRPEAGRGLASVAALRRLGTDLEATAGVVTVVEVDPEAVAQLADAHDGVQFAREALSNVGRHARATTCRLRVVRIAGGVLIEVDDDGIGFEPSERVGAGLGLVNLHERAAALGGTLEIEATPGEGTTVRVRCSI